MSRRVINLHTAATYTRVAVHVTWADSPQHKWQMLIINLLLLWAASLGGRPRCISRVSRRAHTQGGRCALPSLSLSLSLSWFLLMLLLLLLRFFRPFSPPLLLKRKVIDQWGHHKRLLLFCAHSTVPHLRGLLPFPMGLLPRLFCLQFFFIIDVLLLFMNV